MSSPYDWNELDRAIHALGKSTAALPEIYRQLTEGELCALMPYHPEVDGETIAIQNGSPFNFVRLQDAEGEVVPIFSSEERAEESLTAGKVPPNTFCTATMKSRDLLEILGKMNMQALLNKGCSTGTFVLPPDMMRDLASGEALKPANATGERVEHTLRTVEPADYPTDLIQPLFETLRCDGKFRAAWVFRKSEPTLKAAMHYMLMVVMNPRDAGLEHHFRIVLANTNQSPNEASATFVDENDAACIAVLLKAGPPFYRAPDFEATLESLQ